MYHDITYRKLIYPFVLFPILSTNAYAEIVDFIHIDIPGLHEKDQSGKYDKQLINKLETAHFKDYNIKVVPAARAFVEFQQCANCCISPVNFNDSFYDFKRNDYLYTKNPMGIAEIYIWTLSGKGAISKISDLTDKRVGIRRGMPLGKIIENANLNFQKSNSILQNIKKLESGRIDAFIDYNPDVPNALKANGYEGKVIYDQSTPLEIHPDHYICKKTDSADKIMRILNGS